jgi:hypothetical protein
LKERIVYLSDVPYALRQSEFVGELTLVADQAYIPLRATNYAAFVESHPHFLLLRSGEPRFNWTYSRLADAGWRLSVIASSGRDSLYRAGPTHLNFRVVAAGSHCPNRL